MQRFRVDLKTFWAWLCLTNAAMLSESKYLADFLVGFLGKKPQIFPTYSTTILYDKGSIMFAGFCATLTYLNVIKFS